MHEAENELELIDYLKVFWKRKWLILIPTFILMLGVGFYSFLVPQVWEVEAIIQPGKFDEVVTTDLKPIVWQINQGAYNNLISAELNLDLRYFPNIKAEILGETNLVRVSLRDNDVEKAKRILFSLFNHLKAELDKKIDREIKNIDTEIENIELERELKSTEMAILESKLRITEKREKEITEEREELRQRLEVLKKEQMNILNKKERSESETVNLLLYSNEIQQSLREQNSLNELLSQKKFEKENIHQMRREIELSREKLNSSIKNLTEKKAGIDYAKLIKEPAASASPLAPRRKINISIACLFGLLVTTILAFFLEYIEKQRYSRK